MQSSTDDRPSDADRESARSGDAEVTVLVDRALDASSSSSSPAAPTRLGRYIVVEQVGAGGMGRVLRAYDPKLRREVALKLLHTDDQPDGTARIIREAQAMARLSDPNLVPIYDVEHEGDVVFIVMEYVEGDTLRGWLETPHTWRQIVAAFVDAGRGLAAAHAAEVVHRDFKPTNVMVGADGRVRVMDFGVARGVALTGDSHDAPASEDAWIASQLTQAGTVIGTPPYMAPEQHRGESVGPASDQYAFCVALFEALAGTRPFAGKDLGSLLTAKLRGVTEFPPAAARRLPSWLQAAVIRGLAAVASERWPSMLALLSVLERGQSRARTKRTLVAIAALGVVGAGVVVGVDLDRRRREAACARAGESIGAVWNDDARGKVRTALISSGLSYAEITADKVMPWLDRQASAWQLARTDACLAADVNATWTADTLERSTWCLDERHGEFVALVGELSRGDGPSVTKAIAAAAALDDVGACTDPTQLARLLPPPELRDEIRAMRAELASADMLERTGKADESLAIARAVAERADAIAWPALSVAARAAQMKPLDRTGTFEESERVGSAVYFEASQIGEWDLAAKSATHLIGLVGYRLGRREDGLAWARHAEVALAHVGASEGLVEARRLNSVAGLMLLAGDSEPARAHYERSLAIYERILGEDHPGLAQALNNYANYFDTTGDIVTARAMHARVLAIKEEALGPEHPDVATTLSNLGGTYYTTGDLDEAQRHLERSLEIREKVLPTGHPDLAQSLINLGNIYQASGAPDRAIALLERGRVVLETAFGPDHPDVALTIHNIANAHDAAKNYDEARRLGERALPMLEKALGPDHPLVAASLRNLGKVEMSLGDARTALPYAERAVAIFERHDGELTGELDAYFDLARALVETGGDRVRARELAEHARDGWSGEDTLSVHNRGLVTAWLAENEVTK